VRKSATKFGGTVCDQIRRKAATAIAAACTLRTVGGGYSACLSEVGERPTCSLMKLRGALVELASRRDGAPDHGAPHAHSAV
jgi:hypothetical protein